MTTKRLKPWVWGVLGLLCGVLLNPLADLIDYSLEAEAEARAIYTAAYCWTALHGSEPLPATGELLAWFADWSTGVNRAEDWAVSR